MYIYSN